MGQPEARRGIRSRHARPPMRAIVPAMPEPKPAFPELVEIVVEIPRGSRNKYEYDERAGVYRLDRVLSSAVFYNFDYGFIEGTRADDDDHTDALLIIDEPTFTGCHVYARPVGVLEMRDEKGVDFKVLCVALGDPNQAHIERLDQIRPHRLVEIEHFFQTYKLLEDKTVDVLGWRDHDRALEILRSDRATWERETASVRAGR
jgi:inorganic pyrophosphatase